MSTRRRSPAASRAEVVAGSRLRMDRNPHHTRINDPALPAGRRKEIDNVMKRARAGSPGTWDRKLLEVEEKDPNRWRHTGYKQLYLDGSVSPPSRGRRSPPPSRRTPPLVSTTTRDRPRTPPPLVSSTSRDRVTSSRNAVSPPHHQVSSTAVPRRDREREPRPKARRPPSPPPQRKRSRSGSSLSTCTDDSCSMCSLKVKRPRPRSRSRSFSVPRSSPVRAPPPPAEPRPRPVRPPRPPNHLPDLSKPLNCGNANAQPSSLSKRRVPPAAQNAAATQQPTRELLLSSDATRRRTRDEKVLEWQQSQLFHHQQRMKAAAASHPVPPQKASSSQPIKHKDKPPTKLKTHIKKEGEKKWKRPHRSSSGSSSPRRPATPVSPGVIAAALSSGRGNGIGDSTGGDSSSDSDDSNDSLARHAPNNTGKLTLSERFGKMAQWSADRSANIENMRITRRDGESNFTVSIEASESPPQSHEPAPAGHFPEELSAVAPGGMLSWDDVHVRYEYYKSRGYLRGLTLADYVKWEEWWYKYQEWLKRERAYERWTTGRPAGEGRRHRRGRRSGGGRRHRAAS